MPALVRFRFTRDLLIALEGELQPRAYVAPFVYDIKVNVARIAVAGSHGEIVEVHGADKSYANEIAQELLRLVPVKVAAPDAAPVVHMHPTSDQVVLMEQETKPRAGSSHVAPPMSDSVVAMNADKEQPDHVPCPLPSDVVVAMEAELLGPPPESPPAPQTSDAVVLASLKEA